MVTRTPPRALCAWGTHIVLDVLTHPGGFYPTPYLYPFDSPVMGLVDYRSTWFILLNYSALVGCAPFFRVRSVKR